MQESKLTDEERQDGQVGQNLTTHSTEARVSLALVEKLALPVLCALGQFER
jgi:hypothetical protein